MSELNVVEIRTDRSSAKVHLFGATLISWVVDDQEFIFVSEKSYFDGKKAIRGGIPVVFPQFGPWRDRPQHGFARTSKWSLVDHTQVGTDKITFLLEDDEKTRKLWNYKFTFEYTISLKDNKLLTDVSVTNKGNENFSFSILLHTYFSATDLQKCRISCLKGCSYIDKTRNGAVAVDDNDELQISEFTDRVYQHTPAELIVAKVAENKSIKMTKRNFPDTVVWNPWIENAKSMMDFGDGEWKKMVCVEAGHVATPFVLGPSQMFSASQVLEVIDS